ncbi:DMT family transporter [Pseudomonas wadenswilerensis]
MDVLMGLLAAFFWGATDFLIGLNARVVGVKRAVFFSQSLGFSLMAALLLASPGQQEKLASASGSVIYLGIIASLLTLFGALTLSKAFATGKTAIVAPLITLYGVVTTLLAWLGGEVLTAWQWLGILICISGVLLASSSGEKSSAGHVLHGKAPVAYALLAATLYGASFWVQGKYVLSAIGPINMLVLCYAIGCATLAPQALKIFREYKSILPRTYLSLLGASLLNLAGFLAFAWGAQHGSISVVTVMSTLSGAIAAFLGYLLHKEYLKARQVLGVALVLLGAMSLHLYG